jgi:hypothetical protein
MEVNSLKKVLICLLIAYLLFNLLIYLLQRQNVTPCFFAFVCRHVTLNYLCIKQLPSANTHLDIDGYMH